MAANPTFHGRTKHIEVGFHFVHDKAVTKQLAINHVPLDYQIADFLTKNYFTTCFHNVSAS